ncbi:MAG: apbE [Firmicutes bacterium]|nr:apbE [Bacillota bacterium]
MRLPHYKVNAALLLIIIVFTAGCFPSAFFQPKPYKETQFLMDTIIEITASGPDCETAVKAAFDEFRHIQKISDHFNPDSQVSKINQMAGISPVTVDHDLINMVTYANDISKKTDGAFDISIGPLSDLWGIGHKDDFVPAKEDIDKVLPLVDYRKIQVNKDNETIYLEQNGMKLDLGGVAKDYALNKAAEVLKAHGIKSALINAGGDIQIIGTKPDGKPWRIGVQDPRNSDNIIAKITMDSWNISQTSGDYQRFFIKNGIRYAHILDPKTGKQAPELASVTLIYNDSAIAAVGDIASSAFMVLGLEKGMSALQRFPGVEAIFITTDNKIVVTPGLQDKVELSQQ